MLCTLVVRAGLSGGEESKGGTYWRWPGRGGVNGAAGCGEY